MTRVTCGAWRWLVLVLLVVAGHVRAVGAQVRPDSAKRADSVKVAVPVPPPAQPSAAQPPARRDSVARDSIVQDSLMRARILARSDSVRRAIEGDTIKSPLAHFDAPPALEVTDRLRWRRDSILATGALNLADLLDRVPGVTTYRSGWLAGIHAATFNGDGSRIRVFLDGVELDPVEPRNGGLLDLT
ncbi:Plug domain-containing protein, partial [Gemmatimonas sp.]